MFQLMEVERNIVREAVKDKLQSFGHLKTTEERPLLMISVSQRAKTADLDRKGRKIGAKKCRQIMWTAGERILFQRNRN